MDTPETMYARTVENAYLAYQVLGSGPLDLVLPMNGGFPVDLIWEEPDIASGLGQLASFSRTITFDRGALAVQLGWTQSAFPPYRRGWTTSERHGRGRIQEGRPALLGGVLPGSDAVRCHLSPACYQSGSCQCLCPVSSEPGLRLGDAADLFPAYIEIIEQPGQWSGHRDSCAEHGQDDEARRRWGRTERLSATPDRIAIPRAFMESDVTDVLSAIQAPTLLISRRGDRHVRPEHSRFLATQIPGAKLVELSGDDNFLLAGRAEEILNEAQEFMTGVRPDPVLDRELATVLFTDIVGSTARAVELGDRRWNELLTTHHDAVRKELERYRGREVVTTGDGFLALFDGPARAIQCGLAIRDQLRNFGIDIRAGLHTGESVTAGDDVRGIAVHIGARVAALAILQRCLCPVRWPTWSPDPAYRSLTEENMS